MDLVSNPSGLYKGEGLRCGLEGLLHGKWTPLNLPMVTYGAPFLVQGDYNRIGRIILTLLVSKIKSMSDIRIIPVEMGHGNIAQIN